MDISSITKRQPLNPDDVLYLNGEKCIINAIKGTGTSSIVYEATLDGRKIILKERISGRSEGGNTPWPNWQKQKRILKEKDTKSGCSKTEKMVQ